MSEWQPIETAPKDGSEFQAWVVNEYHQWWEPRARFVEGSDSFQVFGRVDYDIDDWDYVNAIPTHWMPHPQPPKEQA